MDIVFDEEYEGEDQLSDEAKYLISTVDPFETNQIIFSEVVKVFTSHPAKAEGAGSEIGLDQISILEKFVAKAIEQEESQKRIMIKLQERIIEESKQEDLADNNYEEELEDTDSQENKILHQKQFVDIENQNYDELQEEYEQYDRSKEDQNFDEQADGDERKDEEANSKDTNKYLAKSLEPVEEDEKEEVSQRSLRNSNNHKKDINSNPHIDVAEEDSQPNDSKDEDSAEDEELS